MIEYRIIKCIRDIEFFLEKMMDEKDEDTELYVEYQDILKEFDIKKEELKLVTNVIKKFCKKKGYEFTQDKDCFYVL